MISVSQLDVALQTRVIGRTLRISERVDSTNAVAASWASDGAEHGALVIADHQTAGRGRRERGWHSTPGDNLTFSVVLRPHLAESDFRLLPLAACLAVRDTVASFLPGSAVGIKWPNDVLVEGRKCSGILAEAAPLRPSQIVPGYYVLGIGLNVNERAFPATLRDRATSMSMQAERQLDRVEVLAELLGGLEHVLAILEAGSTHLIRDSFVRHLLWIGKRVNLQAGESAEPVEGILIGIDEGGGLRLKINSAERTFHAGDVSLSPAYAASIPFGRDHTRT